MTQEPHPDRQTTGKIDLIGYLASKTQVPLPPERGKP